MNIFDLPPLPAGEELFDDLVKDRGIKIERIISTGQASPAGFWYEQERDEWVVLLQGEAALSWEDGRSAQLKAGDCLLIPAGERHRVERTSVNPPCIWLAVHGHILRQAGGAPAPR